MSAEVVTGVTLGDPRYASANLAAIGAAVGNRAETYPRWAAATQSTPTAGLVFASRIHLVPGTYTTVTFVAAVQGVTLTNTFFGLYDTTFANRAALSADVSATVAAVAASASGTITLNYTCTAESDFYLAFLNGSAVTPPQFAQAVMNPATSALTPTLAVQSTATGQTSLASSYTAAVTSRSFWYRYE